MIEESEMDPDAIRALIYNGVPTQVCNALGRAGAKSLDAIRRQTREQLLDINRIGSKGATSIEAALAAIDAAESEAAIVRDVYGCHAGRDCRAVTNEQRDAFEAMIAERLASRPQAAATARSRG